MLDELDERWIERVATDPESIEPSRPRAEAALRLGRIDAAGGKVVRVTTIDENDTRVVITAHFDRRATRLERKPTRLTYDPEADAPSFGVSELPDANPMELAFMVHRDQAERAA